MIIQPNLTHAFVRGRTLGEMDKEEGISNYEPINGSWLGKSMQEHIASLTSENDTAEFYNELCLSFCDGYREGNK
jgi:hypothetical protein